MNTHTHLYESHAQLLSDNYFDLHHCVDSSLSLAGRLSKKISCWVRNYQQTHTSFLNYTGFETFGESNIFFVGSQNAVRVCVHVMM